MISVVLLLIGLLLLGAGVFYLSREKKDPESRKIYTVTAVIGAVLAAGALVRLLWLG